MGEDQKAKAARAKQANDSSLFPCGKLGYAAQNRSRNLENMLQ